MMRRGGEEEEEDGELGGKETDIPQTGFSGSLNQKQADRENAPSSLQIAVYFPVFNFSLQYENMKWILQFKKILLTMLLFLKNRHSFDFLPPLTPAITPSPRRKSGYLNPPIFGPAVRHAAPSTGQHRVSPTHTQIGRRMLTDERLPVDEVPGIGEQINGSVGDFFDGAPASQRDLFQRLGQNVGLGQSFHAFCAGYGPGRNDVGRHASWAQFERHVVG